MLEGPLGTALLFYLAGCIVVAIYLFIVTYMDNETDFEELSEADMHAVGIVIFLSWFSVLAFIWYSFQEWIEPGDSDDV